MSSGELDIKIDLSAYNTTLGKLIRSVKDRRDLMTALAGSMLDAVETNTEQQGRPKWMGWSPAYAKRRGPGQILQKSGRLAASIRSAVNNNEATVGTNVRYARIHNEGGEIRHQARTQNLYFKQYKNGSVSTRFVKSATVILCRAQRSERIRSTCPRAPSFSLCRTTSTSWRTPQTAILRV